MKDESEKRIETYLCEQVKIRGGLCLKLNPFWYFGIQDRLVLLPGARIGFAELKNPHGTGRRGVKQGWWRDTMRKLGFRSEFLYSETMVDLFLLHL